MRFGYHPEARHEYIEAIERYFRIDRALGMDFVSNVESGISFILQNPAARPLLQNNVRRHLTARFPYGIYYSCDSNFVTIWRSCILAGDRGIGDRV